MSELDQLRRTIDGCDRRIVSLLNRRAEAARRIGRWKRQRQGDVYVPAREKQVLDHVRRLNTGPLPDEAILAIYREVMSASLALERPLTVAYFGPPSTFTHQAARRRFGAGVTYAAHDTIPDVFGAVEKGAADYGVVPVENSTEGAVTHTLDQFPLTPLRICAEIYLTVAHHLLAACPLRRVRRIYSHPVVFGQCRRWLNAEMPRAELVPVSSTARAADMAARERHGAAAIAGIMAADLYRLKIVARDIQDFSDNTTRFLVIARRFGGATGDDKTSVLFSVRHRAGALCGALQTFKRHGLNLTRIESRPSRHKAWEYLFFVDLEGHADDRRVQAALRGLRRHCTLLTVLGSYPKAPEQTLAGPRAAVPAPASGVRRPGRRA
jgi:chorismate mutase/prephenate dehydratase